MISESVNALPRAKLPLRGSHHRAVEQVFNRRSLLLGCFDIEFRTGNVHVLDPPACLSLVRLDRLESLGV
jgi:hypothetical protein